jgi:hypothetical protein
MILRVGFYLILSWASGILHQNLAITAYLGKLQSALIGKP